MFKFDIGYLLVISSLLFGSLKPLLMQFGLLQQNISPLLMLCLTSIMAGLFALFSHKIVILEKKVFIFLVIAGVLLFINSFAVILALQVLSVVSVSIIIALTPLLVGVHVSLIKKKILGKNFFWGFAIAFIGVLLVLNIYANNAFTFNLIGVSLSFLAILASDLYRITLEDVASSISSTLSSQYVLVMGAILGFALLPFAHQSLFEININTLLLLCMISFFAFLANLFFVKAIHFIGSTKVSMVYISKPALIALLAFLIFQVSLVPMQILGIILIVLGLFVYEYGTINKQSQRIINR